MQTKRFTEINIYHTPIKSPKPDQINQSHLKTTIPSVSKQSQQPKSFSQFAAHYQKKKNYEFSHEQHDKRYAKNQWQMKEKIQEYQTQISLLHEYLKTSTNLDLLEKKSIMRIFGFPLQTQFVNEQQKVIKQLGYKVRSLIKQNYTLKNQSKYNYERDVEEIILENQNLRGLVEKNKQMEYLRRVGLEEDNERLKREIEKLRAGFEERLKLISFESQMEQNNQQRQQIQDVIEWKQKYEELKRVSDLRIIELEEKFQARMRLREVEWDGKIQENEQIWRGRCQDQQRLLKNKEYQFEINQQTQKKELDKLRYYCKGVIESVEKEENKRLQIVLSQVKELEGRVNKTDQSISHLKFERQNRMHQTIRKSRNVASLSPKPRGQTEQQPQAQAQVQTNNHQVSALSRKIEYLNEQINDLRLKLSLAERICSEKTERIIILQNKLNNLVNQKSKTNQVDTVVREVIKQVPVIKEIIKQVPIIKEVIKQVPVIRQIIKEVPSKIKGEDYSEQVKNIKQSIISCNLSNFDVFQTQFNEILDQRNKMNEKLQLLKKQSKQSSKIITLEKHLKTEREKSRELEEKLKNYEKQIQNLRRYIVELQKEIESMQSSKVFYQENNIEEEQLPDGKAGLEWQRIVKHCLLTSINRLQTLQNRMKEEQSTGQ